MDLKAKFVQNEWESQQQEEGVNTGAFTPGQCAVLPPASSFSQPQDTSPQEAMQGRWENDMNDDSNQFTFLTLYTSGLLERLSYFTNLTRQVNIILPR